jgi:hypothetical protein
MRRSGGRLTTQEQRFVTLVVEEGHSYVSAFRLAYPPRNGPRSAGGERVQAKKVANRPLVQQRMEELRGELLASDPTEMRRLALATLADIMSKRLDPRYRRTALDVLHYLDAQERATAAAEWQEYEALTARIDALDAAELALERRPASSSPRRPAIAAPLQPASRDGGKGEQPRTVSPEDPQVAERRRAELEVVAEQRMSQSEDLGHLVPTVKDARRDDPPRTTDVEPTVKGGAGLRRVRVPGHFGKAAWRRVPVG